MPEGPTTACAHRLRPPDPDRYVQASAYVVFAHGLLSQELDKTSSLVRGAATRRDCSTQRHVPWGGHARTGRPAPGRSRSAAPARAPQPRPDRIGGVFEARRGSGASTAERAAARHGPPRLRAADQHLVHRVPAGARHAGRTVRGPRAAHDRPARVVGAVARFVGTLDPSVGGSGSRGPAEHTTAPASIPAARATPRPTHRRPHHRPAARPPRHSTPRPHPSADAPVAERGGAVLEKGDERTFPLAMGERGVAARFTGVIRSDP
ncbi:hypothetical protein SCANM63S_03399 [Streptomyces canarius]